MSPLSLLGLHVSDFQVLMLQPLVAKSSALWQQRQQLDVVLCVQLVLAKLLTELHSATQQLLLSRGAGLHSSRNPVRENASA